MSFHRIHGVFMVRGRDVERGATVEELDIKDVTPTVLWLIDVPIPEDVDGRVPRELFKPSAFARRPIRYREYRWEEEGEGLTEEQEEVRRLRDLGYIS